MSRLGEGPVRFAVVGCGMLARSQHIPNIARSGRAVLHTCCDLSQESLEACRPFSPKRLTQDYHAAIADREVQAICLATTEKLRLPVIEAAARAGKPIYVEKPLAREMPEIREIQRIVNESKIPFCVGHNRRCSPAMIDAHRIFRSHMEHPKPCPWRWQRESTGVPQLEQDGVPSFVARINDDWHSWKNWVFDPTQAPHGPMLFEMTHFTDLCNWFLADEPVEVSAIETGMLNSAIIIRYRSGSLATITMCANGTFGYPKELYEAIGNGAVVAIDHMVEVRTAGIVDAPVRMAYPMLNDRHPDIGRQGGLLGWLEKKRVACEEAAATGDPMKQFTAEPDKGHAHALDRFIDEMTGKGPVVCGVDDAVLATRVAFAAIKSAKERRFVALEEV